MSARIQLGSALAAARIAADQLDALVPRVAASTTPAATAAKLRYHVRTVRNYLLECERARAALGLGLTDRVD